MKILFDYRIKDRRFEPAGYTKMTKSVTGLEVLAEPYLAQGLAFKSRQNQIWTDFYAAL